MAAPLQNEYELTQEESRIYERDIGSLIENTGLTQRNIEILKKEFGEKWWINRFADCRVPEKDRWFFYFFTFSSSDKEVVQEQMGEFIKEFEDLNLRSEDLKKLEGINQIKELKKTFEKVVERAEDKKRSTSSRAIHKICRQIISEKDETLRRFVRMELVLQKKSNAKMARELRETRTQLEEGKELAKINQNQIDDLKTVNQDLTDRITQSLSLNENLRALHEREKTELKGEIRSLQQQLSESLNDSQSLREDMRQFLQRYPPPGSGQ